MFDRRIRENEASMLNPLRRLLSLVTSAAPRYGADFFKDDWFRNWEELKSVLSSLLVLRSDWRRIIDFGCGPGVMIDFMNDLEVDYWGYDPSSGARELYITRYGRYPDKYLTVLPDWSFDVLLSFDVFEHMTDDQIAELLRRTAHIPFIFANISRAGGIPGHINLKSDGAWCEFFAAHGRIYDSVSTAQIREKYKSIRPLTPDEWNRNMFVFQ